mmetsp:Transcript_103254/g.245930  ORF Transcript_103254/g.245930 Transcript_103254/m.245930 type:complete len:89 (-) Transcript_103254:385-651(-)
MRRTTRRKTKSSGLSATPGDQRQLHTCEWTAPYLWREEALSLPVLGRLAAASNTRCLLDAFGSLHTCTLPYSWVQPGYYSSLHELRPR